MKSVSSAGFLQRSGKYGCKSVRIHRKFSGSADRMAFPETAKRTQKNSLFGAAFRMFSLLQRQGTGFIINRIGQTAVLDRTGIYCVTGKELKNKKAL